MATSQQLSNFLIASERRAYKQAYFATRNSESALDIVQEAMMKLSASYGDRPAEELPLLFTRILQNTVYDFHRKNKTRSMWTTLFSAFSPKGEDEFDILETLQVEETNSISQAPDKNLIQAQTLAIIEEEIKKLSARQREAFLMRYWEELDVKETAAAMGCTQGSVKTHCSRATQILSKALLARGISL